MEQKLASKLVSINKIFLHSRHQASTSITASTSTILDKLRLTHFSA
jgi:hypothetical protein